MRKYIEEMLKRKDLLIYLVKSGLKAEHRNSYLGYFWWLLDPLLGVLVYYFLVGVILGRGGENFAVFLVIGLVAWRWTSTTVSTGAKAILKYSSIINQVYMPKAIFPLTISFTQFINFTFGLVVVAIFLLFFGVAPGWQVVYLPFIILVQLLFLLSISLFLAYICVFIRDIDNLLTHLTRIWFYSSPVIWEGGRLSGAADAHWWVQLIITINPFAHIVTAYRDILMYQTTPQFTGLIIIGGLSLCTIIALVYYYNRNEHKIIKAL
ncbi:teichoic acid ABC transporter permease [Anaerobacillus alkalidiazotrophicus]|uniref:Transport permease protein n=1 Tax=Anaerobacillus alkalidiazotrophicus TaxID=472963 RepID=A0A1S2MBB3_9BACI|nr:ABC transporter permease [Anaerobacillus alkalidiazotrophicus]OIJ21753.1 teichoic acid ABC transporter permease [Anaerobacillus alkalidiazotrophicus]